MLYVLFVKQKTAYGLRISDWGSDLCSSDLVDVPVSSMNTRRSGSSSGWSSSQARRRRRTSGRCCSLACAVFFEGHAVTIEQPPHGALRHLHPVLPLQEIGRAHVLTPVTNAHLVCRLLLEKKNNKQTEDSYTNNIKKRY